MRYNKRQSEQERVVTMAKSTFKEIDIAIANADLTDHQIDRLIKKLHTQKQSAKQEKRIHLDASEYINEIQAQMFKLHNDTPGATFGDVVRFAKGEIQKLIKEIEMRDQFLPTKVIFGASQLDSKHTDEEIALYKQALKEGRVIQNNTPIGMSVFFRIPEGVRIHRLDEFMFQGTEEEAFKEIMPQILAAMQRIPTVDDIGSKSIEGLTTQDIVFILKSIAPYWFMESKKHEYNDKVLEQFDLYWNEKIKPAIKEQGKQYEKNRADAKRHFKKMIKDCFLAYEKRTNPDQYFKKVSD